MTREEIVHAVARGWCDPKNSSKEMDADLANAIVEQVAALTTPDPQGEWVTVPRKMTENMVAAADDAIVEALNDGTILDGEKFKTHSPAQVAWAAAIEAAPKPEPQPSAEDAAVLDAVEKIAGFVAEGRHSDAVAVLARMAGKVPEGWQPLSTLEHRHAYDAPLVMDGKNMPATYLSDSVILTDGKRVWVERSVIMGGALSSSADKFTAYPSGDKPTHWMPLPAAPKVPT